MALLVYDLAFPDNLVDEIGCVVAKIGSIKDNSVNVVFSPHEGDEVLQILLYRICAFSHWMEQLRRFFDDLRRFFFVDQAD